MSRKGKLPITVPEKVKINLADRNLSVEGPLGKLSYTLLPEVEITIDGAVLSVTRRGNAPFERAAHGLTRALIANMVQGVSVGFIKELDINGVGYRAELKGQEVVFQLGYSHHINFKVPVGIEIKVDKQTHLTIKGFDKQQVGQVAADIRSLRKPEPFKGKGIKYSDEVIRRKAGKAAGK